MIHNLHIAVSDKTIHITCAHKVSLSPILFFGMIVLPAGTIFAAAQEDFALSTAEHSFC